jgi:hypothetical protein
METKIEEIWKPVPGIEKYHASSLGRLKNVRTGRIVNGENNKGYRRLDVWDEKTKSPYRIFVHRMILMAFVPNPLSKPCANHKNGIRDDNRIDNLEWATHQENIKHANKTGLSKIGSQRSWAKLDEDKVKEIRLLLQDGVLQKNIAKQFGVSQTGISKIKIGLTWTHAHLKT